MSIARLLAAAAACLLAAGIGYAVYESAFRLPAERRISELESRVARTEERIRQVRAVADRSEAFEGERQRLAAQLARVREVLPETVRPGEAIDGLRDLAADLGLVASEFTTERRHLDFYGETLVRFSLSEATPEQLAKLGRRIHQASPLRKVVELDLEPGSARILLGVAYFDRGRPEEAI